MTLNEKIYKIVSKIPYGKVATYGQIATLCGNPYYARAVGNHRNQKFVKNMPNQPLTQAAKSIFPRIILNPAFNSIHNVIQEAIGIIRLSAFLLIISKEAYFSIVLPNSHPLMQANNGI